MPPRLGPSPNAGLRVLRATARRILLSRRVPFLASQLPTRPPCTSCHYATAAVGALKLPDDYVSPTQPPSARPPGRRGSQLLRTYTSLLRSSPVVLIFQHNNLTAEEWVFVRRELTVKLRSVAQLPNESVNIGDYVKLSVVNTGFFRYALGLIEFFDPVKAAVANQKKDGEGTKYTHYLSKAAHETMKSLNLPHPKVMQFSSDTIAGKSTALEGTTYADLYPFLAGQVAVLTMPTLSPRHLAAALSILAPNKEFPAPKRKARPRYYDSQVQSGISKLLLLGGRIENKVLDTEGVAWVGGIEGGVDALRAQLVFMLQNAGASLVNTLQGPSKSLWLTMESRRSVLEEEAGGGGGAAKTEEAQKENTPSAGEKSPDAAQASQQK